MRGSDAWDSLTQIIYFFTKLLTVASQIALILNLSRSAGGPIFAIVCFMKPIIDTMYARELWDKGVFPFTFKHDESSLYLFIVCLGYVDNEDSKRRDALQALASDRYRQDIISNDLGEWIINGWYFIYFKRCLCKPSFSEYGTACGRLGEVTDEHPYILFSRRNSPFFDVISKLLGELPIVCSLLPFFYSFSNLTLNSFILGILRLLRIGLSFQTFTGFYCNPSTIIRNFPLVTGNYF